MNYELCTMNNFPVFIQSATQISMQEPLSERWMTAPLFHDEALVKAVNPVFRDYIPANEARRMGPIMKRAIVTALKVLKDSGVEQADAIITGTSMGCLDCTERFLADMTANGEQALSPTFFMQSTHNTVGSAVAIYTKSHGYNTTYSQGQLSFDLAMQDAFVQLRLGDIVTALVGGYDETDENYFQLLAKTGYVGGVGMGPYGDVAVSMLLTTDKKADSLCELAATATVRCSTAGAVRSTLDTMLRDAGMTLDDISAFMTGINGNEANDQVYTGIANELFPGKPLLHYKHIFGENYTASAFGIYAAAHCLKAGAIPACLFLREQCCSPSPQSILLANQRNGKDLSFTLLKI